MDNPIRQHCQNMLNSINEIKSLREQSAGILNGSVKVQNKDDEVKKVNLNIQDAFKKIDSENSTIFNEIGGQNISASPAVAMPVLEKKIEVPKLNAAPTPKPLLPTSSPQILPSKTELTPPTKQQILKSVLPTPKTPTPPSEIEPALSAIEQLLPSKIEIKQEAPKPIQEKAPEAASAVKQVILAPELASQKFKRLTDAQKERYLKELSIDYVQLQDFIKEQKKKTAAKEGIKKEDYTIYAPKEEAVIANKYAKVYADSLIKSNPEIFNTLFTQYRKVNMNYLSRSWVSMMLFYSVLSLPAAFIFMLVLKFVFNGAFEIGFGIIILATFLLPIAILVGFYFYPGSLIEDRAKAIRNEMPFALVHMSAVAGSGAHPISIFELLLESDEYPELKTEIKKIMNYVNLFGYNLSTALRNTAATTPSPELKELLNGMVSTIETGGDLKGYLKGKADDMLNNYRLDRKKKVEALGTYSEIYTSILIASPLMLVVTLAIMNSIVDNIAGLPISTVSWLGVGLGLPLLNIGFMLFLKMQTSGM